MRMTDAYFFGGSMVKKRIFQQGGDHVMEHFRAVIIFDRENYLMLVTTLIGVTSLIYNANGNPFEQLLMIVFRKESAGR